MAIITRSGKGSELTHAELDANMNQIPNGSNSSITDNGSGSLILKLGGTGTANQLDDYEEGTWTPAIVSTGTYTYSARAGSYTKIGRMVHIAFNINLASVSGQSGSIYIGGLPYSAVSGAVIQNAFKGSIETVNLNWDSTKRDAGISISDSTRLSIREDGDNGGNTDMSATVLTGNEQIRASLVYYVS